jgi:hypothetical protein
VSESPGPVPQRIGDAERDQAATYLREALAQGRLEQDEFDERVEAALRAKTQADLDPLFRDLPGPRPGQGLAPTGFTAPPWQQSVPAEPSDTEIVAASSPGAVARPPENRALQIAAGVSWPLMIMVCFIVGWDHWWLMFIPIAMSSIAGTRGHHHRDRGHR